MSDRGRISQTWLALVNSGNIRYQALPTAEVAIADDAAWDQLFAAAGAPTVPFWLCGFTYNFATGDIVEEDTLLIDLGWGGVDGATNAAENVILTNYPITVSGATSALGPFGPFQHNLPFPVRIPASSRMAARIASSPVGSAGFTSFRVILATGVGS
ncbi:MAG: hypothetical protein ACUVTR_01950 [Dehalococcoidia bacterium]